MESRHHNSSNSASLPKVCTGTTLKVLFVFLVLVSTVLRSFHLYMEEKMGNTETESLQAHRKVVLNSLGTCGGGLKGGDCYAHTVRLLNYCTLNPPDGDEGYSAHNNFNHESDYELVHVTLTIRHGDRSAIHSIPGSTAASASSAKVLDPHASGYIPRLTSFAINPLQKDHNSVSIDSLDSQQRNLNKEMFSALHPSSSLFRIPDRDLPPGQLTSVGFMQHIHLGFLLSKSYSPLISAISDSSKVYIRSTNYARTIQSVGALLSTLLPSLGGPSDPLQINSYLREDDEVMHGIGLRSSSHAMASTTAGEKVHIGACRRASDLAQKEREAFEMSSEATTIVSNLFGSEASQRFITDLVDASMPSYCHGDPLPCSSSDLTVAPSAATATSSSIATATTTTASSSSLQQSSSSTTATTTTSTASDFLSWPNRLTTHSQLHSPRCLSNSQLGQLMDDADRAYCSRYTGHIFGGYNATKLSIYPFMTEIVDGLYSSVDISYSDRNSNRKSTSSSGNKNKQLNVYSGHDTVIAPVLAALGVFEERKYCKWPSYASRIAFELWKPTNIRANAVKNSNSNSNSNINSNSNNNDSNAKLTDRDVFVRVVFNGEDVTALIPTCMQWSNNRNKQQQMENNNDNNSNPSNLCPLYELRRQIDSLILPHSNIASACIA